MRDSKVLMQRIDQRVAAVGLSYRATAKASGLSDNAINIMRKKIASGANHHPRVDTLRALAPVLHTTVEWLINGIGPEVVMPDELSNEPHRSPRKKAKASEDPHMDEVVAAILEIGIEVGMEITPSRMARLARDPRIALDIESDEERAPATAILKMRIKRRLLAMA